MASLSVERSKVLMLAIALGIGCTQPTASPTSSPSTQESYLTEVDVLQHMYFECDLLNLEKERHQKDAEFREEQIKTLESKNDSETAEQIREIMNKCKEDAVMAEAEMGSIRRLLPAQRRRVAEARLALGLDDGYSSGAPMQ